MSDPPDVSAEQAATDQLTAEVSVSQQAERRERSGSEAGSNAAPPPKRMRTSGGARNSRAGTPAHVDFETAAPELAMSAYPESVPITAEDASKMLDEMLSDSAAAFVEGFINDNPVRPTLLPEKFRLQMEHLLRDEGMQYAQSLSEQVEPGQRKAFNDLRNGLLRHAIARHIQESYSAYTRYENTDAVRWNVQAVFDPSIDWHNIAIDGEFGEGGSARTSRLAAGTGDERTIIAGKWIKSSRLSMHSSGHDRLSYEFNQYEHLYGKLGLHPQFCKVYGIANIDTGETRQRMLLMEALDGYDVVDLGLNLKMDWYQGRITSAQYWGSLQYIYKEVFRAVVLLKEAGLLHGDIKCENIMITNTGRVVLIDLGEAVAGEQVRLQNYFGLDWLMPEVDRRNSGQGLTPLFDSFTAAASLLSNVQGKSFEKNAESGGTVPARPNSGVNKGWHRIPGNETDAPDARRVPANQVMTAFSNSLNKLLARNPNERFGAESVLEADDPDIGYPESGDLAMPFFSDPLLDDGEAKAFLVRYMSQGPGPAVGAAGDSPAVDAARSFHVEQAAMLENLATRQAIREAVVDQIPVPPSPIL